MSIRNTVKFIQNIMRTDDGVDGDAQRLSQLCWMFFLKIIDDQDKQLEVMRDDYQSPIPDKFQWRNWAADPEGLTGEPLLSFINQEMFPALKELPLSRPSANRARVVRGVFEDAYSYMKSGQLVRQVLNKINTVDFNDLAERKHFGEIYEQLLNSLQSAGNAGEYYTPRAVTAFMADRIDPKPGETILDPACGTGGFLTCAIRHMRDRYVKTVEDEQSLQSGLRAVEKKQLPHMLCVTNMLLHGIENPSFVRHDNTLARPYISYGKNDRVDVILTNPPFGGKEEAGIESNFPAHFRTRQTADLFLALFIRLLKNGGRAAVVLPDGTLFGEGVKTRLKEHLLNECNLHTIVRLPNSVFRPYASIGTNVLFFEKGSPTNEVWFFEHRVPEGQKAYSMTRPILLEHFQECVDWWGDSDRNGREQTPSAWRVSIEEIKDRNYDLDFSNPYVDKKYEASADQILIELRAREAKAETLTSSIKTTLKLAVASEKQSQLMENFARALQAPGAASQLAQLVINLAIRGRLVPQDSNEPFASELLEQIVAEKNSLVQQGKFKALTVDLPRDEASFPFHLPPNWVWCYLNDLAAVARGGSPRPIKSYLTDDPAGIPWIKIGDSTRGSVYIDSTRERIIRDGQSKSRLVVPGDLLLSNSMSFGYPYITNIEGCIHDGWLVIRTPESLVDKLYLHTVLLSDHAKSEFSEAASGAVVQNLNADKARRLKVPLPPFDEQCRIVAKVNQLIELITQLEAELAEINEKEQLFSEALFREAM